MRGRFKVGDKIEVVNSACSYLKQGSVHTAHEIYSEDGYTYVSLSENGRDEEGGWDITRFVKYEEKENSMKESNKVEMDKEYRVASTHRSVRVICTDRKYTLAPCVGLFTDEDDHEGILFFDHYGYLRGQKIIEEVPAVDWSTVQVDAPIWVKSSNGGWYKRHFRKIDCGGVHFWPNGTTSFSYEEKAIWVWNYVQFENCSLEEPK